MQLIQVITPTQANAFIQINKLLNATTPNYIQPLYKDVDDIFNPKKNKTYRHGEAIRWILVNTNNEYIGRIAAFTNQKYITKGDTVKVGGVGFFDCINDQAAANLLFATAQQWLTSKGVQAMDGPINFGERDKWWGLVVQGFEEPPYNMNYNPPYYIQLFENFGFQPFFYQYCYGMNPQQPLHHKITERHAQVATDKGFTASHIQKNNLYKYAEDFTTVYNKAWSGHGGLKQLKLEQVKLMFTKMKPIMDERIIWFVYYHNAPIAMFINIPDLNQYFKHMNGKFGWLQKLYFLYLQKFKKSQKFTGLVFGVIPEYQGKGIDAYMIEEARRIIQTKTKYNTYEMQWIGDFNPKMMNIASNLGDTFVSRKLCTYRYNFDREKVYERHPIL